MYSWLFLAKPFVECEQNPADRKRLVRDFVATSLAPAIAPETFELARPHLRLALRTVTHGLGAGAVPGLGGTGAAPGLNGGGRAAAGGASGRAGGLGGSRAIGGSGGAGVFGGAGGVGGAGPTARMLLRRPALPFLDEVVLVEQPRAYLDDSYPAKWGVSAEEIFAAARASMVLAAEDLDGASTLGRSVIHVPDYGGGNVISRILLDGWLAEFADRVGGQPVAFIPSNLMLLVCVDEPALVTQMFQLAGDEYGRTARPMSPMAYTPDANGRISVYEPVAGHPAYHAAGKARRRLLTNVAERQRQTLGDPRLAECTVATRLDGSAFSAAMWELGSVALLPKVDFAGLAEPGERPFFVPWAVLAEADLLVEEIDHRPARFSTPARPTPAALGYLRERAVSP